MAVRDVRLRWCVPAVSNRAHRAPLAVTNDGQVLINLAMFDVAKKLDALVSAAR